MLPFSRIDRVNHLIQEELSKIVFENFEIENALVTVLAADTSKDLIHTKVLLGIYPQNKGGEVLGKIKKFAPELQRLLNKKLRMRPVPKIEFMLDESGEQAARIGKLLGGLRSNARTKRKRGAAAK